jgi:hypothetical protein
MANETREKLSDLEIATRLAQKAVENQDMDPSFIFAPGWRQHSILGREFLRLLRAAESPSPSVAEAVDAGLHETLDMNSRALVTYRALLEKAAVDCGTLVAKLDEINAHPAFQSVFAMAAIHGAEYRGPNYSDALEHARATLASIREALLGKGREE